MSFSFIKFLNFTLYFLIYYHLWFKWVNIFMEGNDKSNEFETTQAKDNEILKY